MNTQPLSGRAKIRIQVCVCPWAVFFLLDPLPAILTFLTYSHLPVGAVILSAFTGEKKGAEPSC